MVVLLYEYDSNKTEICHGPKKYSFSRIILLCVLFLKKRIVFTDSEAYNIEILLLYDHL